MSIESVPDPFRREQISQFSFDETVTRLRQAIDTAGLTLFAVIDHAAGAHAAGLAMPSTVVLLYGHPSAGTPIMQASPLTALDLPLRVLVRADEEGLVWIAHRPIAAHLRALGVPEALAAAPARGEQKVISAVIFGDAGDAS